MSGGVGDLYIIGAGGHAREIHSYVTDLRRAGWNGNLRGCFDDALTPGLYGRLEVLGPIARTPDMTKGSVYIAAVGSNPARRGIVDRITALFGDLLAPWTLIHPTAQIGEDVTIGEGTCLAPNAIVTAASRIGRHTIVNVKASVSHDCKVGDFVNINPSATICGCVEIGDGAFIGAGATIRDHVSIGGGSVIGAGAVVICDIPANATAVGVPARVVRIAAS